MPSTLQLLSTLVHTFPGASGGGGAQSKGSNAAAPPGGSLSASFTVPVVWAWLQDNFALVDLLVNELAEYKQRFRQLSSAQPASDSTNIKIGRHGHLLHLQSRLNFLFTACKESSLTLTVPHCTRLWSACVEGAASPAERTTLLVWIARSLGPTATAFQAAGGKKPTDFTVVSDDVCRVIFESKLSTDPISVDESLFSCFTAFFLTFNTQLSLITSFQSLRKFEVRDPSALRGMLAIWRIILRCSNPTVVKAAQQLLIRLHVQVRYDSVRQTRGLVHCRSSLADGSTLCR